MSAGRPGVDCRRRGGRRRGAAGSVISPPPDHSGASPPVGRPQCPHALVPGQPSASRRWHPGCRRCLLKGCERWFLPRRPQARYCSTACQVVARRWRRWLAARRYRATGHGRRRRRDQARRHRGRARQRSTLPQPDPPTPPVEPPPAAVELPPPPAIDPEPVVTDPGVGQRPDEIPGANDGSPCHRPGCYVLFLPTTRSPDRRFCSASCRRALRRVRQREARLRRRRRRGIPPRRRRHRGPPRRDSLMSSRIEQAGS
jgi:hypothetical protein